MHDSFRKNSSLNAVPGVLLNDVVALGLAPAAGDALDDGEVLEVVRTGVYVILVVQASEAPVVPSASRSIPTKPFEWIELPRIDARGPGETKLVMLMPSSPL